MALRRLMCRLFTRRLFAPVFGEEGTKMPAGRPSKYKIEYADQAFRYCLLGATNERMAEFFDVDIHTFDRWWRVHEEFRSAITRGREDADAQVAKSLYQRALGYSHNAVKHFIYEGQVVEAHYVEHYPPDTNAASLWLRNRQPALWRDKQEIEHTVRNASDRSDEELERIAFNDNEEKATADNASRGGARVIAEKAG